MVCKLRYKFFHGAGEHELRIDDDIVTVIADDDGVFETEDARLLGIYAERYGTPTAVI